MRIKKRYSDAGFTVHNMRNLAITNNQVDIVLNRPDRHKKIEDYKTWLRMLGKAGFHYTLSNFNLAQIVTSGQVAPVAEEAAIVIGFHPDDPPVPPLSGVPRILSNFNDCKKALKIANSPNVGICLCCGTRAEGGGAMVIDPASAIRRFGARKQIYEILFRNVSSPLPHFEETHVDNGYYDMFKVMKALVNVKYDGIVHLDHAVPMAGGNRTYEAFAMGYMRAMRQRALAGDAR